MNLYGLSPQITSKVSEFSRKHHLGAVPLASTKLDGLIVLGDGTPDDWAVCLISHHLDGSKTVGIAKPEVTGVSTFNQIRKLAVSNNALKNMVFFIDQEESSIIGISDSLEQRLQKQNIQYKLQSESVERFRLYSCLICEKPRTLTH